MYRNQFLQKAFGFPGHLMLREIQAVRYTYGVDINLCAFVEDASEGGTENLIRRRFRQFRLVSSFFFENDVFLGPLRSVFFFKKKIFLPFIFNYFMIFLNFLYFL